MKTLQKALLHASVILTGMIAVLLAIDRINSSMVFIDNDIFKGILAAYCVINLYVAISCIKAYRRKLRIKLDQEEFERTPDPVHDFDWDR